jgi:hypothetical protein
LTVEETKIPMVLTATNREKTTDVKELKQKYKKEKTRLLVEIRNLKHRISLLQCGDTNYLGNGNVAMENCVLAYRTPVGKALYTNRQELEDTYFKRGIQQDIADHRDLLNKMPYDYSFDLEPLNKKVA